MAAAAAYDTVLHATRDYTNPRTAAGLPVRTGCFYVLLRERGKDDPTRDRRGLYFVYNVAGAYGYVPKNCMGIHPGTPPDQEDRRMGVAVGEYQATDDSQITVRAGDILYIVDRSPTGWFFGRNENERRTRGGWFPSSYIRDWFEFPPRDDALSFQFVVQAMRCQLDGDGYLPFVVEEWMDVIRIPNTNDTEWIGRNAAGRIGKIRIDRLNDERGDLPSVLLGQPWYHNCDRRAATELLQPHLHQPAHFIIRDASQTGNFAITVTNGDMTGPLNVRVVVSLAGYDVEGRNFESLEKIVSHYSAYPIHRDEFDGRQIFLHHHVARAGSVDTTAAATGAAGRG